MGLAMSTQPVLHEVVPLLRQLYNTNDSWRASNDLPEIKRGSYLARPTAVLFSKLLAPIATLTTCESDDFKTITVMNTCSHSDISLVRLMVHRLY